MSATRDRLVREAAARGKYAPLYRHLLSMAGPDWRASFAEVEAVLGFRLPDSARLHRPWWANSAKGNGHSHALAWQAAGWKTGEIDLDAETLLFARDDGDAPERPAEAAHKKKKFDIDEVLPVIRGGSWPPGFTVSREQIYDEFGRLTGGPQDEAPKDR
ncbi:MAG: hypothetical protein OXF89_17280 [Rhodospirillaceae bacterium]|nr:hypothetical protein [Rhodospirillaceae bacterium]MCY4065722.1 hypothetical protein [Rhodospirillaceae bacterium]